MSSARYPGKVLETFNGGTIISSLVEAARKARGVSRVVVLTSVDSSDDLLASYLEEEKMEFFRGSLGNVFDRFREALKGYPCDIFARLCGDSPLLDPKIIDHGISLARLDLDLVSNVPERTFPSGQSVEIVNTKTFQKIDPHDLTDEEKEHVTLHFYKNPEKYKVLSLKTTQEKEGKFSVDTPEDMKKIISENLAYHFDASKAFTELL